MLNEQTTEADQERQGLRVCAAGDCDQPAREDGFCSASCFDAAEMGLTTQPSYTEWVRGDAHADEITALREELAAAMETIASIEAQYGRTAHRLSHVASLVGDLSRLANAGRVGLAAVETVRALEHVVTGGDL